MRTVFATAAPCSMVQQANPGFLRALQRFTADAMITPSALRNVGAKGARKAALKFLAELSLEGLSQMDGEHYLAWLNEHTDGLQASFPQGAQKWGPARKAMNIFMRTAAYTSPLAAAYQLERLLPFLEVPLDSYVATALQRSEDGKAAHLHRWVSIVSLNQETNQTYQRVAEADARRRGVYRADLDVYYWGVQPSP